MDEPFEFQVQHQVDIQPPQQQEKSRHRETETWFSGEQDTSQVSVSSLPEDEKSEPTNSVSVSSATTTSGEFNLSTAAVVSEEGPPPPPSSTEPKGM